MMNPGEILQKQFSEEFVKYMRNRCIQGFFKYGLIREFHQDYDLIACCKLRIKEYEKTGNTEFLVDAANFLMFEFMFPCDANGHFRATKTEESPGLVMADKFNG